MFTKFKWCAHCKNIFWIWKIFFNLSNQTQKPLWEVVEVEMKTLESKQTLTFMGQNCDSKYP